MGQQYSPLAVVLVGLVAVGFLVHRAWPKRPSADGAEATTVVAIQPAFAVWTTMAAGVACLTLSVAAGEWLRTTQSWAGGLLSLGSISQALLAVAIVPLVRSRTRETDWTGAIDAACVVLGVTGTALVFLPQPADAFGLLVVTTLALAAALALLLFAPGERSWSFWLLVAGLATAFATNIFNLLARDPALDLPGTVLLGLEAAAVALLGGAAAVPSAKTLARSGRRRQARLRVRSLVPLGFALGLLPYAGLLDGMGSTQGSASVHTTVSLAMGLLVILRTVVVTSARDDERSAHELSARRFRSLVENGSDVTCTVDADGKITYVSPSVLRVLGQRAERAAGMHWQDVVHLSDVHRIQHACAQARRAPGRLARVELRVREQDEGLRAGWRWCDVTITNRLHDPAVGAVVCNLRDISEHKRAQHELARQALHDALTGLPNRVLLLERLEAALDRGKQDSVAVAFIDLDRFKEVNDSLGHDVGDQLLVQMVTRIKATVRRGDIVARFGGDEFVIVCEHLTARDDAVQIVHKVMAALQEPLHVDGHELHVTPSVGIAFSAGNDDTAHALIRDADAAMYRAKERGRARCEVFDQTMRTRAVQRLETGSGLHRAVERSEFRVFYQPIVAVRSGRLAGVEALVRWQHPRRGLMSPAEFIDLAEELGLTAAIGGHVLDIACDDLARWNAKASPGGQRLELSVNISARQLRSPGFPTLVRKALARSGVEPSQIVLEITENVLLEHAEIVASTLEDLRALGVQLCIDDFGAGYTSLSYLKRFPVDIMKIDQSFVRGICDNQADAAVVAAVIDLAHTFGTSTVAEGVETAAQLARLGEMDCDYAQGYLFSQPRPAYYMDQLLDRPAPEPRRPTAVNRRHLSRR